MQDRIAPPTTIRLATSVIAIRSPAERAVGLPSAKLLLDVFECGLESPGDAAYDRMWVFLHAAENNHEPRSALTSCNSAVTRHPLVASSTTSGSGETFLRIEMFCRARRLH